MQTFVPTIFNRFLSIFNNSRSLGELCWWVLNSLSTHMFISWAIFVWRHKRHHNLPMWLYNASRLLMWNGHPCLMSHQLFNMFHVFSHHAVVLYLKGECNCGPMASILIDTRSHTRQFFFACKRCEPMEISNNAFW